MQGRERPPGGSRPPPAPPAAYQPQEGGAQHRGGEPAQRALGPGAPPGAGRRLRLGLRRSRVQEEPLPSSRGPGLTELQFQLQLGGSKTLSQPYFL